MAGPDRAAGEAMRRAYAAGTAAPVDWLGRPLAVEPFGGAAEQANELLGLVRAGIKTATCSALCWYEAEGAALPAVGGLWAICDGGGVPACLVETTRVEIRRFADIDEAFARAEGEGDRSLGHWRRVHEAFFESDLRSLCLAPGPSLPLVCEWFRVVFDSRISG